MGYYSYPKGDRVFHFRVSDAGFFQLQTQLCLRAERAQVKQGIRDVYLGELGLQRLTKVIALEVWVFFPIWDIPLQGEAGFQVRIRWNFFLTRNEFLRHAWT